MFEIRLYLCQLPTCLWRGGKLIFFKMVGALLARNFVKCEVPDYDLKDTLLFRKLMIL